MNKKMAREIVESLPSLYPLMTADEEEAIWTVLATNSNTENDGDYISRQQAIDAIENAFDRETILNRFVRKIAISAVRLLPSAQPDNQVHLCDSCSYTYPECPSVYTDMIFGNGSGNDNICACSKYLPLIKHDTDTISRQVALDIFDDYNVAVENGQIEAYSRDRKRLCDLPSAQPEQRWIPITERLPKKQAKVLVVDFGEVDTAYLNSEGRWMDFNGDKLKDVKAWMPLPKWEGVNSEND